MTAIMAAGITFSHYRNAGERRTLESKRIGTVRTRAAMIGCALRMVFSSWCIISMSEDL